MAMMTNEVSVRSSRPGFESQGRLQQFLELVVSLVAPLVKYFCRWKR